MKRSFSFWCVWLIVVTCATIVAGLAMVVIPNTTQRAFDGLYLSSPGGISAFGSAAAPYIKFVSAVLGAVMAGWAAAILYALLALFRYGRPEGWRLIVVSLAVWFVPDTTYSLVSGFRQNAVLSVAALLLFAVPLAATYSSFFPGSTQAHPAQTKK